ncbi:MULTISPECIES: DUF4153 domain-containing protein [Asticcacaulis]|uniref:DUF4153 domain-containing protein n=1 Tax=Asticcacaulis TaxID=76890 RepID=UPI001AE89652|nr:MULTISPECIES: DUF4153 domain-containing protein [Asticcacaulis]MBP2160733.1 hypothetical protein [Asticcacaulis solisilvae]MDR6801778.1 hypothetical protein [Asticcacaulis sp. BE141]
MPANSTFTPQYALIFRLAIGLVFGLGLAWLTDKPGAARMENWHPETWRIAATSTLGLGAFIFWAGAGAMRRLSLAVWGVVALALIAFISWSHAAGDASYAAFFSQSSFLIYPFLFIAHELVSSGDQARKIIAPYPTYFDEAWKRGVQLALAILFTALFWAILWLGAALLGFIGFNWLRDLLSESYFGWPMTGLAFAAAVHLGDVQPKLMAGFRALVLGVLSWLLPVITLIGVVFAASLCVSGLEPLWKTKAATASLLAACVALVLLINAAYQQGDEERPVHVIIKWSARLACGLMLVFSALAAFSLGLRIQQYGLTPERVLAGVGVIIALAYGASYTVAALWPKGRWLNLLEPINIGLAFIKAALLLAVLTPVANPNRLSVESQVARVQSGKVTTDRFDWQLLRFNTGAYGRDALKKLTTSGKTGAIRDAALTASRLKDDDRYASAAVDVTQKKADPKQFTVVFPQGAAMPEGFFAQAYGPYVLPDCATEKTATPSCSAAFIDMSRDGQPEMLILDDFEATVFVRDQNGWHKTGTLNLSPDQARDFKAGKLKPQTPEFDDLKVGDAPPLRLWVERSK